MLPTATLNRLIRRLSLRTPLGVRSVLAIGACASLLLGLVAYSVAVMSVRDAAAEAAIYGATVSFGPFVLLSLLSWLAFGTVVWAGRSWLIRRDDHLLLQVARLASNSAGWRGGAEHDDPVEQHLEHLGELLAGARAERDEARAIGQHLLHLGPHYTLLCTLAGKVLDANGALLARTGVAPNDLSSGGGDALVRDLRLKTLLDLGRRSLREKASIAGIEHSIEVQGEVRPVVVALRGLHTSAGPIVLMVLADRTETLTLERQIDQFSDALELMVDQRVAKLTARQTSVDEVLAGTGLLMATFDEHGSTERLNAAVERATGRTRFTLADIDDVAAALVPQDPDAFTAWFWRTHEPAVFPVCSHGRTVSMAFARGSRQGSGEDLRHVLIGLEIPSDGAMHAPALVRLRDVAAELDPADFEPALRPYVEVVREATRRLYATPGATGDGAPATIVS